MFERFTPRARHSIVLAEEEARSFGHGFIGPEHLLLGLIHEGDGVAAKVLERHGVTLAAVRSYVTDALSSEEPLPKTAKPPFKPQAKKTLEFSLREALRLGHNYIGTEHILLGLIRQADEDASPWLGDALGTDTTLLPASVEEILKGFVTGRGLSPATDAAMKGARGLAGRGVVTTGHLLWAMLEDERSMASTALAGLGVARDAVEAELAQIDIDDTSDSAPPPQHIELRVGDTTTRIQDPTVATALGQLNSQQIEELLRAALTRRRGRKPPGPAS